MTTETKTKTKIEEMEDDLARKLGIQEGPAIARLISLIARESVGGDAAAASAKAAAKSARAASTSANSAEQSAKAAEAKPKRKAKAK